MEQILCNPAYGHILERIFLQLEPKDLENCRKVHINFKNVLDQPLLWLKINRSNGIFEHGQKFKMWETLVKSTSRTHLAKNVAKILMGLNDLRKEVLFSSTTENPFHFVAYQGSDLQLMEFMVKNLEEFGYQSLDQCLNADNCHPLHEIITSNGNVKMVKFLIENTKNLDVKNIINGWTPMHIAACVGNLEAVKLLLENGADPNPKDIARITPIIFARINRHYSPKCKQVLDYLTNFLTRKNIPFPILENRVA